MAERIFLPRRGRTSSYFADFTLFDQGNRIIVKEGWIQAEGRGKELMSEVMEEFRNIARTRGKPLVHQFEGKSLAGRKFIQHYPMYKWAGRSSTCNPLYECTYSP